MFGHYFRSLDEKNRVIIPAKLRLQLGKVCYVTVGFDKVMELRDQTAFDQFRDKLVSPNMLDAATRRFARVILGNTIEAEIDAAGRISLPETALFRTGVTKEVAFVGVGNKVEIWPKAAFDEFQSQFENETALDDLAAELAKKGISL